MPQGLRVEGVLGEGTDIPPPQFEVLEMPIQRRCAVGSHRDPPLPRTAGRRSGLMENRLPPGLLEGDPVPGRGRGQLS